MRHICGEASLLTKGATLLSSGQPLIATPIKLTTVAECAASLASRTDINGQDHRLGHCPKGKPDAPRYSIKKNPLRIYRVDCCVKGEWTHGRGLTLEELLTRCNRMLLDHRIDQIRSRQQSPQEATQIIKAAQARMEAAGIKLTKPRKKKLIPVPVAPAELQPKMELVHVPHSLVASANEPEVPVVNAEIPVIEVDLDQDLDQDLDVYLHFEAEDPGDLEMIEDYPKIGVMEEDLPAIQRQARAEDGIIADLRSRLNSPYSWDREQGPDLRVALGLHMADAAEWHRCAPVPRVDSYGMELFNFSPNRSNL